MAVLITAQGAVIAVAGTYIITKLSIPALLVLAVNNLLWLLHPALAHRFGHHRERQRQEAEIRRLRAEIDRWPDNPAFRSQLGDIYLAQRRYDEARTEYETVIAMVPRYSHTEQVKLNRSCGRCLRKKKCDSPTEPLT